MTGVRSQGPPPPRPDPLIRTEFDRPQPQPVVHLEHARLERLDLVEEKHVCSLADVAESAELVGTTPSSWGGTRCAASMSSRLVFFIGMNSSFAATSAIGMTFTPSCLPPGTCRNMFLKLPGPFESFIAWRIASVSF